MKKFILLAAVLGIALAAHQPAKAQVSINVNFGTPSYYVPRSYNAYYVPARTVVYTNRNVNYHRNYNYYPNKNVAVYRSRPIAQRGSYYNNYRANSHYSVKNVNYKHYNKSFKHSNGNGHGKGKH